MSGKHEVVSVVAGGWSFTEVDPSLVPGFLIAVNDSAVLLPRWDCAISMDRLWAEDRWAHLRERRTLCYLRRSAAQNIYHKPFPWAHIFDCDNESHELSPHDHTLNGANSGECALNLAHTMRPRELLLFGFDMQRGPGGEPYWYPPYPWRPTGATTKGRYRDWAAGLRRVAEQLQAAGTRVTNVSSRTLLDCFDVRTPAEMNMQRSARC